MNENHHRFVRYFSTFVIFLSVVLVAAAPASSDEYAALKGVDGIKAVFEVSLGSPAMANIVFGAVKGVYADDNTRALSRPAKIAVVFHGPAVKLISTNREGFKAADSKALDEFADTIRQMKKDGVKLEVCDYALKVMGVDPASILPEVDHVGNGFISVIGYQAQGYSHVLIN
jgi:uncharacterized protein